MNRVEDEKFVGKLTEGLDKDLVDLYNELSLAMELMVDEKFKIINSNIINSNQHNGINYNIITEYPLGLPESVGNLFYNIDYKYNVNCEEIKPHELNQDWVVLNERWFRVSINKNK